MKYDPYDMALGYAWGRQDEQVSHSEAEHDTGPTQAFARAYADHAADYREGRVGSMCNLGAAYAQWVETGVIK